MRRSIRFACLCGWYLLVAVLALLAIAVSSLRLLMPLAEDYRGDLEAWLERLLGQPVTIETLDASWRGFEPLLVLEQVELLSDDRSRSLLRFDSAKIGVDLWASLSRGRFVPGTLIVTGAKIHLTRHPDGRIAIASLAARTGEAAGEGGANRLGEWLLSQRLLELQDSELHWRDLRRDQGPWAFSHVNLRISNLAGRHRLSGSVSLPEWLGEKLQVAMDIQGDILAGRDWSGEAFIATSGLQLERVIGRPRRHGAELVSARIAGAVWASWRAAELVSVRGKVQLDDLQLRSLASATLVSIDQMSTRFGWLSRGQGWRLGLDDFYLQSRGTIWPSTSLFAEYAPGQRFKLMLSHANLHLLNQVQGLFTLLPEEQRRLLRQLDPVGSVRELFVNVALDREQPVYLAKGKLRDFGSRPHGRIPGLRQLAGDFVLTPASGSFQLLSRGLVIDYPRLFDQTIYLSSAEGFAHWRKDGAGWRFVIDHARVANRDIDASLRLALDSSGGGASPFIDALVRLNRGLGIQAAKRYLPRGVMKPWVRDWMRKALLAGRIEDGAFLWHGPGQGFPYRDGSGKLELRLALKQGRLRYAKAWPAIDAIDGEFIYTGYGLRFDAKAGRTVNHDLRRVRVRIDDFGVKPLVLRIDGEAEGLTQDKLNFLYQSPLKAKFANALQPMRLQGRSTLKVSLNIPLRRLAQTEVEGVVSLERNRLDAEAWKLAVDQLEGELRFDRWGFYAAPLRGWLGGVVPLEVIIDTLDLGQRRELVLTHAGRLDRERLRYVLRQFVDKPHWANYFRGETQLLAQLRIPLDNQLSAPLTLSLNSNLKGAAITLPEPLAKDNTADPRLLRLNLALTGPQRELRLRYGGTQARFRFAEQGRGIERGAVVFGGEAQLPQEHGFRYLGHVGRFSWSDWSELLFPPEGERPLLTKDGPASSHYFDLAIDSLEVFGAEFGAVKLQASNSTQGWSLSLDGPALAGNVFIPVVATSMPMSMDMARLFIPAGQQQAVVHSELDPRRMPVLKINVEHFRYRHIDFGRLSLRSSRRDDGLDLDSLSMRTDYTRIEAQGDWTVTGGRQRSRFDITVTTRDLGNTLKEWGYAGSIAGGVGEIKIQASWPGRPTQFAFEQLTGRLSMDIRDGSLLEVQPGAARLFGLLSLQALPRRLFLDFSDVFAEGLIFDELKGEFRLDGGDAFTDGLSLDGPSAAITMAGRVGLVGKDYDQVVTVIPKLGASLPLLGALAVTPQVGATLFVVQKLLQKQIDDISALQYIVTGSWDEPDIRQIAKPGEAADEEAQE